MLDVGRRQEVLEVVDYERELEVNELSTSLTNVVHKNVKAIK